MPLRESTLLTDYIPSDIRWGFRLDCLRGEFEDSSVAPRNGRFDYILSWLRSHLTPGQVFTADQLGIWAEAHGYVNVRDPFKALDGIFDSAVKR